MSIAKVRLDRLLVSRGLGGRREIQQLIKRGLVSSQGEVISQPNHRVDDDLELMVAGVLSHPLPTLLAYHKPLGQLSTLRDPWGRAGLDLALPEVWREVFHPVGRLDADTSGLILFSSNGTLTQRLLHPKRSIPRTYLAHVHALPESLEAQLSAGVETSSGCFTATLDRVRLLKEDDFRPSGAESAVAVLELTVCEGKYRMVRRMLHNAGASVLALHRLRYGSISLGSLEICHHREVSSAELIALG